MRVSLLHFQLTIVSFDSFSFFMVILVCENGDYANLLWYHSLTMFICIHVFDLPAMQFRLPKVGKLRYAGPQNKSFWITLQFSEAAHFGGQTQYFY